MATFPSPCPTTDNMIIAQTNTKYNTLTQSIYNLIVNSLDINNIKCTYCNNSNFHYHGYYNRNILINNKKKTIKITRIKCSCCNKTHSILCYPIIPFISIIYDDVITVICNPNLSDLDLSHINYFINKIKVLYISYDNLCKLFSRNYYLYFIPT